MNEARPAPARHDPTAPTVFATDANADLYGASRMFLESVRGMTARGWRVVVSTAEPAGALLDEVRACGGEVRHVPTPVLRKSYLTPTGLLRLFALTVRAIPAEIRLLREVRPDVLYVNTITQPLWLVLGWLLRIPVVCHVHEAEGTASRARRVALAAPLFLARRLLINSRFSMDVLTSTFPKLAPRCVVVPNGVAGPPEVVPPRPDVTAPIRLLYVGRLSDRKGTGDAIEAVDVLRTRGVDARLDVVGAVFTGNEAFEAALREQVTRDRLDEQVCFRGQLPSPWPALALADILLVPSRVDEPFGNTAVEGILAARPVVATRTGGLLEATAGYDAAITVAPRAPNELADAVQRIVADWAAFRECALADATRAAARHAPTAYQSVIADGLEACVEPGRTHGGRSDRGDDGRGWRDRARE